MKWIKVDPANLPQEEVLARNEHNIMVGFLSKPRPFGIMGIVCSDVSYTNHEYNISHYLPVETLLQLDKET